MNCGVPNGPKLAQPKASRKLKYKNCLNSILVLRLSDVSLLQLNERDRKLDVGLLHSGKFQEALDGLAKWLTDTEEMVANQKPPSADYKVVKAQLQEQKVMSHTATLTSKRNWREVHSLFGIS